MRLIAAYEPPARIDADVLPRPATGCSLTEAPRGLLYHRYRVDGNGLIVEARIVPPTAQNQAVMEDDLRRLVSKWIDMPKEELTRLCEQAIRNYDPCISCATHLLRVGPVCNL
jgi:coenzyme F420-reducing hydrogenase alpha subunit